MLYTAGHKFFQILGNCSCNKQHKSNLKEKNYICIQVNSNHHKLRTAIKLLVEAYTYI